MQIKIDRRQKKADFFNERSVNWITLQRLEQHHTLPKYGPETEIIFS